MKEPRNLCSCFMVVGLGQSTNDWVFSGSVLTCPFSIMHLRNDTELALLSFHKQFVLQELLENLPHMHLVFHENTRMSSR